MNLTIDPNVFRVISQVLPFCLIGGGLFLVVFVVLPLLFRASLVIEALSLLVEGLGSYFDNRLLVWAGCFAAVSLCGACCILTLFITISAGGNAAQMSLHCGTTTASFLCGLLGK